MARKDNRIAVGKLTITLAWPRIAMLDRAIRTGKYRTTLTNAAEAAIEKHLDYLAETNKIADLTAEELKAPPPDLGLKLILPGARSAKRESAKRKSESKDAKETG